MFGLRTSIAEESMVDMWTLFGSDLGVRNYLSYTNLPELKSLIKDNFWPFLIGSIKAIPAMFRVWKGTRRMSKRWQFFNNDSYMDRPLVDIRREFNIKVLSA